MKKSILEFFGSKKVKVFLIGVLALGAKDLIGLDDDAIKQIVNLASAYILGQSAVDVTLAVKGKK